MLQEPHHIHEPYRVYLHHRNNNTSMLSSPPPPLPHLGRVLFVENIHLIVTLVSVGISIDPAVLMTDVVHVVLEDVEDAGHLGEDEDPAPCSLR